MSNVSNGELVRLAQEVISVPTADLTEKDQKDGNKSLHNLTDTVRSSVSLDDLFVTGDEPVKGVVVTPEFIRSLSSSASEGKVPKSSLLVRLCALYLSKKGFSIGHRDESLIRSLHAVVSDEDYSSFLSRTQELDHD